MAGKQPDEYRPRRAHVPRAGPEETSVLPRTGSRALPRPADDAAALGSTSRTRLVLLVAAVAAVVALGLAAGYAALGLGDTPVTAPVPKIPAPRIPAPSAPQTSAPTAPEPTGQTGLLTDQLMLGAAGARQIDRDRTWRVAQTQRGLAEDSPRPACLDADQVQGQPAAQQTALRLLSSSGKRAPGLLHQASAYASAAEARRAYAGTARALGGCVLPGGSIDSGARVRGLGDQALGMVVRMVEGSGPRFHTLVLSRTGRVVDVVDVASPTKPVGVKAAAKAASTVVAAQCRPARGACADDVSVADGPPPPGGDAPGFLAAGDLPAIGPGTPAWAGDQPSAPKTTFTGSQCESVEWARVKAESRAQRTYVQSGGGTFGLDEIVLTLATKSAAQDLVAEVRQDLRSCEDRLLTAQVADLDDLRGTGANRTKITGWATTVRQQTASGTTRYRVAMVAAGEKAVFTFLNPQRDFDLTTPQWRVVAVRAGERATQVS